MVIRKLTVDDLDSLWTLRLQSLANDPEAFGATLEETQAAGKERMRQRLCQDDEAFYLGAFEETLIGIVRFHREGGLKDRHKGSIFSMYVAPEKRGLGVGRALMQALIALAKRIEGLEQLHLTAVTTNFAARNLYLALGFQVYGTEPRALKLGGRYWDEDLLLLDLREVEPSNSTG